MTLPDLIGVYGGGRMGAGITHSLLVAGSGIVVIEVDDTAAESARDRVASSLTRAAARGVLDEEPADLLARLTVETDAASLVAVELVVEAVPEDPALKSRVLAIIEAAAPDAYVATNTSSLSVDGLAVALAEPERFIGLHFFNPVAVSELVEIVVGSATSPDLVRAAQGWVDQLGKTAITVTDTPGFASSRLGVAIALEAMRMLDEGVASAADIDAAMTLGYRHPTGPLRTTDIVGLDVRLAIAEHLERELGPRFSPPEVLREKVAAGLLGRKAGEGFYTW